MNLPIVVNAAGGLALFLLAMLMMTEGLKIFAGRGLKTLLERWTSTPLRGVFAGMLVTGLVQASAAVTVATIGFVNAGVITLRQALGVIYGTNVGTTMTAWLVSLVGFDFDIETFALPILTIGVALRLLCTTKRWRGLGDALAGFGLFFLGLALLKGAFVGFAGNLGAGLSDDIAGGWLTLLGMGFLATVLMQSSSAAIAILLTAASGGVLTTEAAAVAVIGANVGTTSTAAIAVLRATSAAKRLALGHIVFNLATGAVALIILPGMLWLVAALADWLDIERSPAAVLALFHSVFNILGVLLILPLSGYLANGLERLFRSAEEDLGRPQHLDPTTVATPSLAAAALREELLRLRVIATHIVGAVLAGARGPVNALQRQTAAVAALGDAIAAFIASVRTDLMSAEIAAELAQGLRTTRYLEECVRLSPYARELHLAMEGITDRPTREALQDLFEAAAASLALAARAVDAAGHDAERSAAFEHFERCYETAKTALLQAAVARHITVDLTETLLDQLRDTRRLVEQLVKADRLLRSPSRAAEIEQRIMVEEVTDPAVT
ncbi:MAG: Na/Pi symporter [Gammaproteobacteria bacterium]